MNPLGHNYRRESGRKVLRLLRGYVDRYPIRRLQAIDNIPRQCHYYDLFPALKKDPLGKGAELWYGIRTDTHRRQVRLLAETGVRYVTPGIETLSSHLLKCLNNNEVTALQNIYFLKLCRLYGIYPEDRIDIPRIAYYFDCEWKDTPDERAYDRFVAGVWVWIDFWRGSPLLPSLNSYLEAKDRMILKDTRRTEQTGE